MRGGRREEERREEEEEGGGSEERGWMESNCVVNEGGVETKRCEQKRVGRRSESLTVYHIAGYLLTSVHVCSTLS